MPLVSDMEDFKESLNDVAATLLWIDFNFPTEPRDDASAEDWRDYGLEVADKLADAEKAVEKAIRELQG